MDRLGASIEVAKYTERLVPSTRFVAVDGVEPVVSEFTAFVAPSASVVGDVTVGKNSSVWYGAIVRGDVNKISIGENTSIGDRAVVYVEKIQGDLKTIIGNNVTVGPCAIIHAATVEDFVMVGASAQVLDGAIVGPNTMIAPGAVVTPGTKVPSGEMWAGSPAKKIRALTEEEFATITDSAKDTVVLAALHATENEKDYHQIAQDENDYEDRMNRDAEYTPRAEDYEDPTDVLGQGSPGRIFDNALTNPMEGLKLKQAQEKKIDV